MSTITKEITLTPEEIWNAIQQLSSEEKTMLAGLMSRTYEEYQCGKIEVTEEQLARAQKGARLLVELARSVKGKWKSDKSAVEEVHHARKRERGY